MKIPRLLFFSLFSLIVNIESFSQPSKADEQVPKNEGSPITFRGGVLYEIGDICRGLKDLWKASVYENGGLQRENLALFTSQGLLVLPNEGNDRYGVLGSLRFLGNIISKDHTKVTFAGEEFEILGMIHTHPDLFSTSEHAPYDQKQFEWKWTTGEIGNYVIATNGIYQAQPDYLTSKWIGFRKNSIYQLIVDKYYLYNRDKYESKLIRKSKRP